MTRSRSPQTPPSGTDDIDQRVRAALERVERGTFGLCVDCGAAIERKRLDRAPLTERCWRCEDHHRSGARAA